MGSNPMKIRRNGKSHILYPELSFLQRPFYKIFVKVRNNKKNVVKIVLIIVNINKDESKSLISNQFSRENDL
jgi:hypothetical protein